jgi:hypothetical protein
MYGKGLQGEGSGCRSLESFRTGFGFSEILSIICDFIPLTKFQVPGLQPVDFTVKDVKVEDTESAEIIPLPDFDWRTTEPLKFRNFKSKYHLTMGTTSHSSTWSIFRIIEP